MHVDTLVAATLSPCERLVATLDRSGAVTVVDTAAPNHGTPQPCRQDVLPTMAWASGSAPSPTSAPREESLALVTAASSSASLWLHRVAAADSSGAMVVAPAQEVRLTMASSAGPGTPSPHCLFQLLNSVKDIEGAQVKLRRERVARPCSVAGAAVGAAAGVAAGVAAGAAAGAAAAAAAAAATGVRVVALRAAASGATLAACVTLGQTAREDVSSMRADASGASEAASCAAGHSPSFDAVLLLRLTTTTAEVVAQLVPPAPPHPHRHQWCDCTLDGAGYAYCLRTDGAISAWDINGRSATPVMVGEVSVWALLDSPRERAAAAEPAGRRPPCRRLRLAGRARHPPLLQLTLRFIPETT